MSTLYIGFDNCDTSTLTGKHITVSGGSILTAAGRGGRRGLRLQSNTATITPPWGASQKLFIGLGFKTESPSPQASDFASISFRTAAGTQGVVRFYGDGKIEVYRGAGVALLASAPVGSFPPKAMRQIVLAYKVSDTTGDVLVKVGPSTLINLVGNQNTRGVGTVDEITQILIDDGGFASVDVVDLWVSDDTDHGTKGVLTLRPTGDGDVIQFTRSSGSTNFQQVNEAIASTSDTTKNSSSTAGQKDLFETDDVASNVTGIVGVQCCIFGNVDDASSRTIAGTTRSGADVDTDGAAISLSSTPSFHVSQITDTWTTTKVNETGRQFGYKLAS